jgi:hypothetical protein
MGQKQSKPFLNVSTYKSITVNHQGAFTYELSGPLTLANPEALITSPYGLPSYLKTFLFHVIPPPIASVGSM